ncbi:MAG: TolC family protein [Anaerotignum sp.]|jgi:outer membrane protein TolC|nr:TolC family protein [Anaerotignum sp.]
MNVKRYKKMCALLLAGAMTAGMTVPAYAAQSKNVVVRPEKASDEPMTLEEIQKEVQRSNRLNKTLELNFKKVEAGLRAVDDGLTDLTDMQNDAAHSRRDASNASGQGHGVADKITAGADTIGGAVGGAVGGGPIGDAVGGGLSDSLKGLAGISSGLLSAASRTAGAMETMVDTIAEQQRDTLEDQQTGLKNTRLDLKQTQQDWKEESQLVTQLLVTKTVQVEAGIALLAEKQELLERVCEIEGKKAELGFSTNVDLEGKKLEVAQGAKDLQDAADGLTLLKRQLNDLMGRDLDETLVITPPEFTRDIETAPEYTEELLKQATDKSYKLKTLRRDKQQAEEKTNNNSLYDGQIRASELDMDIADVAMEDEKASIANDLKKKLDAINAAAAAYQNQKDTLKKAKTEWEHQQASAKLGIVSPVELQALQLQYEQTELALMNAAYAYDIAWGEYTMMMEGTSSDIYNTYKAQLG